MSEEYIKALEDLREAQDMLEVLRLDLKSALDVIEAKDEKEKNKIKYCSGCKKLMWKISSREDE